MKVPETQYGPSCSQTMVVSLMLAFSYDGASEQRFSILKTASIIYIIISIIVDKKFLLAQPSPGGHREAERQYGTVTTCSDFMNLPAILYFHSSASYLCLPAPNSSIARSATGSGNEQ